VTGAERLVAGRETFSRAITLLLTRNHLSHAQLSAAASWASPETPGWLSTSQISYYRTQHNKILGPKPADALGQLNLALAMLAGDDSESAQAMKHLGRPPIDLRQQLRDPFYLRMPETLLPMNAGDLFMVWIGRMVPHELTAEPAADPVAFSAQFSEACQDWFVREGKSLREGMRMLLEHYPVEDQSRIARLQSVVAGLSTWSAEQITEELEVLAVTLGVARNGRRFTARELLDAVFHHSSPPSIAAAPERDRGRSR
jgi:hypothetical protein